MWQTSRDMLIRLVVRSRLKPSVYQQGGQVGETCYYVMTALTGTLVFVCFGGWGGGGAGGWLWGADRWRQRQPSLRDNRPLIGCIVALLTNHAVPWVRKKNRCLTLCESALLSNWGEALRERERFRVVKLSFPKDDSSFLRCRDVFHKSWYAEVQRSHLHYNRAWNAHFQKPAIFTLPPFRFPFPRVHFRGFPCKLWKQYVWVWLTGACLP